MKQLVWLTGVSGAGKTTTALALKDALPTTSIVLDADILRKNFWPDLGLSEEDRRENVLRIARLANFILSQLDEGIVIVACIAPKKEVRDLAIESIGIEDKYLVYLDCNLEERIRRDPKGLYKRAISGEISNLTGYDGDYNIPDNADLVLDTDYLSIEFIVQSILQLIGR